MAVYFLTFLCHTLFEALFVKKTQEIKHPMLRPTSLNLQKQREVKQLRAQ